MNDLGKLAKTLCDRLVKKHVGRFEIFLQSKRGVSIEVLKGKRENYEVKNSVGFGLRVIQDQRLGFSYGTDFSRAAVDFAVEQALKSAQNAQADSAWEFAAPQDLPQNLLLTDADFASISVKEKMQSALAMEQAAYDDHPAVKNVRNAGYEDEWESTLLLNSDGWHLCQERSLAVLSLMAVAEKDGESEAGYEHQSGVVFKNLQPHKVGQTAAQRAVELLGGKPIPNYVGPAVFHHTVATELLGVLAPSFFGDNVAKKNSSLISKLGQKVYASSVNIFDDGLMPDGSRSGCFDGEGTPRHKTILVQNGVVQNYLYDLYWAKKTGALSTGNAQRGSCLVAPRLSFSNLYIGAGSASLPELIGTLKRGVFITELCGMHTANPVSGDFSVGMQGLWIENGQKSGAIKSVALAGNLHAIFDGIIALGSDLKFYGAIGSPSWLVKKVEISGSN